MTSGLAVEKRPVALWCVVLAIVAAATAVLFYICRPESPSANYWIAMGDIVLMELLAGGTLVFSVLVATRMVPAGETPVAMSISRSVVLGLFLVGGIGVSLFFAFMSVCAPSLDTVFRVILVVKWIALLVIMAAMWTVGNEGAATRQVQVESRKTRILVSDELRESLANLRNVAICGQAKATWQKVVDELDGTCNRVRSWISARPENSETNPRIEALVASLQTQIKGLASMPADQQVDALQKVSANIQDIAREVRRSATSSSSGIS